ncbi:MAG TPA: NADPH-dependent F420 reductase [Aggregatilineales bacterium]|nr:NADPH-dependent F420 reductase [Aggregatilineales bacterium]
MTDQNISTLVTIAVVGGTGKEGSGLAMRLASSGYRVIIGSRDGNRAQQKAEEFNTKMGSSYLRGMDNHSAVKEANLVIISVPYESHEAILTSVADVAQGKIVIDVTVPVKPSHPRVVNVPEGKAACLEAQALLGPDVKVVAAFQNVSYDHLQADTDTIDCDVLICGDDDHAKNEVIRLAHAIGMRGIDAGPLANAVAVEALTPVLMYINRRYKVKGAGIVITGLGDSPIAG